MLAAGGGHGTFIPITVASAPLCIPSPAIGFFTAPILWAFLFRYSPRRTPLQKRRFYEWITLHYVSACLLLAIPNSDFADWKYVPRVWAGFLIATGILYLCGQLVLWLMPVLTRKFVHRSLATRY